MGVQRLQAQSGASAEDAFGNAAWNNYATPLNGKNYSMSYMVQWKALGTSTGWLLSSVVMSIWTSPRRCPLKWSGKQHKIQPEAAGYLPTDVGVREDHRPHRWSWIHWIPHWLKNQAEQPDREVLVSVL
jgi:hypothetical protein